MKKNKTLSKIVRNGLFTLVYLLGVVSVYAQIVIDTGDESKNVVIDYPSPSIFTDLRKYGVLNFVGYIASFFLAFLFFMVVAYTIIIGVRIFQSQGDKGKLTTNFKAIQNFWIGLGTSLAFMLGYVVMTIFLGAGNIFEWPSKFAQCGNGELLIAAELRAGSAIPDLFRDETLIYCCESFDKNYFTQYSSDNLNIVEEFEGNIMVGDNPEDGGWLFIADVDKDGTINIVPIDIIGVNNCEPFTLDSTTKTVVRSDPAKYSSTREQLFNFKAKLIKSNY